MYAWNAGDSTAYQGKAGDFTDDAAAMLPTYEDVLADEVQLTAAGRQDINGDPCIAVTFEQDGYRCVYAVSTVSGLLAQASFYDGDTLTRKVTVSELSTGNAGQRIVYAPDRRKRYIEKVESGDCGVERQRNRFAIFTLNSPLFHSDRRRLHINV